MNDPTTARGRASAWQRVPLALRVGGLGCGCFLLVAGAVYLLGAVAMRLASLTVALVAAVLIAALLEPVVNGLRRLRVPRGAAALAAVLLFVLAMITPVVVLWRLTRDQFGDIAGRLSDGLDRISAWLTDALPISRDQVDEAVADLQARVGHLLDDPLAGVLTVAELFAAVVLALFVSFFLLKDGRSMAAWAVAQLPERVQAGAQRATAVAWYTMTRYVRGTVIVSAIDAIGIGVALALIGVPFAVPLGLLVFVGSAVPYVGATVTGAVAVLVALAANGPVDALLTLAAVIGVQQLEGNLLEPLIVGRQVRLHPVAVVTAVFAGSLTAGIAGAVIAVPLVAVTYRVYRVLRDGSAGDASAGATAPSEGTTATGHGTRRAHSPMIEPSHAVQPAVSVTAQNQ
jgi:predicted PurR-regulated permease PerM